jgi:GTPase
LFEEHVQVIDTVLAEIGAGDIPTVLVPNKIDIAAEVSLAQLKNREVCAVCPISALTGEGVDRLLAAIGAILDQHKERFNAIFSQAQGALIAMLRERGRIVEERYQEDGVHVTAMVTPKLAGQLRKLLHANGRTSAPKRDARRC